MGFFIGYRCSLSVIGYQLSVISYRLSVISYRLSGNGKFGSPPRRLVTHSSRLVAFPTPNSVISFIGYALAASLAHRHVGS
jgi:hypothetical protein